MAIKGDTTQLVLNYKYDGKELTDSSLTITKLWMQFNKEGGEEAITFKLGDATNPIVLDSTLNKYVINLTQAQSLKLGKTIKYQMSINTGGGVFSSDVKSITRGELLRTSEVA